LFGQTDEPNPICDLPNADFHESREFFEVMPRHRALLGLIAALPPALMFVHSSEAVLSSPRRQDMKSRST